MEKKLLLLLAWLLVPVAAAHAEWVWTPETGRWVHPRFSVRETAVEQLQWAEEDAARGDAKAALRKFRQLVRFFPHAPQAGRARFRIGEIYEQLGDTRRAVQAYQEILEKHPGAEEVLPALDRLFEISRAQMLARGRFLSLRTDPGKQVMALVEKAPYAPQSEKILYDLGMYYLDGRRYAQAAETFEHLIRTYPEGRLAPAARFRLADALFRRHGRQESNRGVLLEAQGHVSQYLAAYPDGEHGEEGWALYRRIRERLAEMELETARFYQRTGQPAAAVVYYRRVIDNFPGTAAAAAAEKNLP